MVPYSLGSVCSTGFFKSRTSYRSNAFPSRFINILCVIGLSFDTLASSFSRSLARLRNSMSAGTYGRSCCSKVSPSPSLMVTVRSALPNTSRPSPPQSPHTIRSGCFPSTGHPDRLPTSYTKRSPASVPTATRSARSLQRRNDGDAACVSTRLDRREDVLHTMSVAASRSMMAREAPSRLHSSARTSRSSGTVARKRGRPSRKENILTPASAVPEMAKRVPEGCHRKRTVAEEDGASGLMWHNFLIVSFVE
mmetsp:Transcript_6616/g.14278  ORF Transcript_6616/g.14278 Transcript_6616/m.14278 type:complete len:251 (-) Transcript_6616:501-1253(-)